MPIQTGRPVVADWLKSPMAASRNRNFNNRTPAANLKSRQACPDPIRSDSTLLSGRSPKLRFQASGVAKAAIDNFIHQLEAELLSKDSSISFPRCRTGTERYRELRLSSDEQISGTSVSIDVMRRYFRIEYIHIQFV